eukprot:1657627-Alexandrium_andersonii.AAC.1
MGIATTRIVPTSTTTWPRTYFASVAPLGGPGLTSYPMAPTVRGYASGRAAASASRTASSSSSMSEGSTMGACPRLPPMARESS